MPEWRPGGYNACIRRSELDRATIEFLKTNFQPHPIEVNQKFPVSALGYFDAIVVVWRNEKYYAHRDFDYSISMKLEEFKKAIGMDTKYEEAHKSDYLQIKQRLEALEDAIAKKFSRKISNIEYECTEGNNLHFGYSKEEALIISHIRNSEGRNHLRNIS